MKIILVGASGTIGRAIIAELSDRHEIVKVGNRSGDFQVDITSVDSIDKLFADVGPFDALICAAGDAHFGPLDKMTEEEHMIGIKSKLMGQG